MLRLLHDRTEGAGADPHRLVRTMKKETLIQDIENMEDVLGRTAERSDIWQDRCIYAMAKAIWHILQWIRRQDG